MLRVTTWDVPPSLRDHVARVWRVTGTTASRGDSLLPDVAGACVAIHVADAGSVGDGAGRLVPSPRRLVAGSLAFARRLEHGAHVDTIGITLPPLCACLLGVPAGALLDAVIPLSEVSRPLDRALAAWAHRVERGALDLPSLFGLLARHLRVVCDPLVRAAGGGLERGQRVEALASALDLSRRQLVRRFEAAAARTPRDYKRLARFTRASSLAVAGPRPRWAAIAAEAGYVDQAHLVRDFRALAGATPTRLFSRDWYEARAL